MNTCLMCALYHMVLTARKTVFGCVNNKGVEQPAHPDKLLEPLLFAFWKISYLNLLQENLNRNPEDRFSCTKDNLNP